MSRSPVRAIELRQTRALGRRCFSALGLVCFGASLLACGTEPADLPFLSADPASRGARDAGAPTLDAEGSADVGDATATADLGRPDIASQGGVCSDGVIGPREECDDGNSRDFDRCNNRCEIAGCNGQPLFAESERTVLLLDMERESGLWRFSALGGVDVVTAIRPDDRGHAVAAVRLPDSEPAPVSGVGIQLVSSPWPRMLRFDVMVEGAYPSTVVVWSGDQSSRFQNGIEVGVEPGEWRTVSMLLESPGHTLATWARSSGGPALWLDNVEVLELETNLTCLD